MTRRAEAIKDSHVSFAMDRSTARENWFQAAFGHDYLRIYPHRDHLEAEKHVDFIWKKLGLHEGSTLLDLGCGYGRHSLALSRYSLQVVGIDLSEILLAKAVRESRDSVSPSRSHYVKGDMRLLPFLSVFDAVLNFFTSFGYFDRIEEDRLVLQNVLRVLKPGGLFWFDYLNIEYALANLVPFDRKRRGSLEILQKRRFDEKTQRLEKEIIVREASKERRYIESVRAYSRIELITALEATGFHIKEILGDYHGNPFAANSPRLIFIGQKSNR
ncbi:methyltransferase domain-containing protein [candidate division KSB1 bacterium]|nr:methyltransferase domain-containing protein [candidate division KSB1 bacterium]